MSKEEILAALCALALGGCYRHVGPIVSDVTLSPSGQVLVTRCMLHVAPPMLPLPLMPSTYELQDCATAPAVSKTVAGRSSSSTAGSGP